MEHKSLGLPLILGTVTTAGVIVAIVVVVALTGFLVQSFTLLFVIPAGAGFAGSGCAAGVFLGLLWINERPGKIHYWIGALLALCGFIGTYIALYMTTYVTKDLTLNHSFNGIPISNVMSFFDYMRMDIGSRESTFFINVGRAHVPIGLDHGIQLGPLNWISFVLEPIGYIAGGLTGGSLILGNKRYCNTCKVYMKAKDDLFRALISAFEKTAQSLNSVISSGSGLRTLVESEKQNQPKEARTEPHVRFAIEYCPRCFDGYLYAKLMRKTRDGFDEVRDKRQTIKLDSSTVHEFIV